VIARRPGTSNGFAGFIPAAIPVTIGTAPRQALRPPASRLKRRGGNTCQSAPKPTSKNGGMMLPGTRRNMRVGNGRAAAAINSCSPDRAWSRPFNDPTPLVTLTS
jgi:hypothetical protein